MIKRYVKLVLFLKWPLLLGLLLISLMMAMAMVNVRIDPSVESLFSKNSPEYIYYREYREKYGSDAMIALAMATDDLFTVRNLKILKTLTEELGNFTQVERVLSLSNAMTVQHRFMGVKAVPALDGVFEGEKNPAEVKQEVLADELFVNNLVSKDGRVANILIYLKPVGKDNKSSGVFIEKMSGYLESLQRPDLKFYIAGSPMEHYEFIRLIRRDQLIFIPLITLLLVVTTYGIYRSLACVILSMTLVFMTLIFSFGTIVLSGQELNLVTSLLAPVIMIIAVVNSIHLMNLFFEIRERHASMKKCVSLTIEQIATPCFLAHFTTILGFVSLAFNPTPAIRSFGIFAAVGTLYSYLIEMLLTPILFPILPYREARAPSASAHFFNRFLIGFLEKLEFRWKWWIMAVTVVVLGFSFAGIKQLNVDTSLVKQMKPDMPLAVATRFIDGHVTGVYSLGFVFRRKNGKDFQDSETLKKVEEFKIYLESKPEIVKVNAITTVLKKIHAVRTGEPEDYAIPEDAASIKRYFAGMKESGNQELWSYISRDFKEIRIEARMRAVGTREGWQVETSARDYLHKHFQKTFTYELTGSVVLLGRMSKDLVSNQMQSFGFAFASILLLMAVIFRSLKIGLLAAIPNLVPILVVYGVMGWCKIDLSTSTAMISSIVLGMVVDAAIHFLHRFRLEFEKRGHYLQAMHHTFRNVGQALVVSTVILSVGFASSVFANFMPTFHFGVLTSMTILIALVCTLVLLPVCIIFFKPFGRGHLFKKH